MARKRNERRQREVITSIPSLTVRPVRLLTVAVPSVHPLRDLEDRRTWHPLGDIRPARYTTGGASRIGLKDRKTNDRFAGLRAFSSQTKAARVFADPDHTALCVRRHVRREVLFAKRRAGMSGRNRKPRRRNWFSSISC